MAKATAKSIVRMESTGNRTPTGRRSATGALRLARYFALGRGTRAEQAQREQRGIWYEEKGKPVSHEEVLTWVKEQALAHRYTHQFVLSARDTSLTSEEYSRALQAGGDPFSQWRLIAHTDSQHPHAHAMSFSNEEIRIKDEAFQEWWLAVRTALERAQGQHLARRAREQELKHDHSRDQQEERHPGRDKGKEIGTRLERDVGRSRGLEM